MKRPQIEARARIADDHSVSTLSSLDLLDVYWRAAKTEDGETLQNLAREIIEGDVES